MRALVATTVMGSVRLGPRLRLAIQSAIVGMGFLATLGRVSVYAIARFGLRVSGIAAGLGVGSGRSGLAGL
jgi:hypothetical protein